MDEKNSISGNEYLLETKSGIIRIPYRMIYYQERIVLHRQTDNVMRGDYFVLCSDGVYKYCKEEYLKTICKDGLFAKRSFLQKIHEIKDYVYEQGASDNMSMILVRIDTLKK